MKILLFIILGVVVLFILAVVLLFVRAVRCSARVQTKIEEDVYQVLMDIEHGGGYEDKLLSLAERRDTRGYLYRQLHQKGWADLFPDQYKGIEKIAESDLAVWLLHPNELNALPDEMELVKIYETRDESGSVSQFYLFRYRTLEPHWASNKGWIAGIAGPYIPGEKPMQSPPGVFSRFDGFETRTPDEHCEITIETVSKIMLKSSKM